MKQHDLKTLLHESIENIEDEAFLIAIKQIVDRKYHSSDQPVLSKAQMDRIKESKEQIEQGKFLTNDQADQLVERWLKE